MGHLVAEGASAVDELLLRERHELAGGNLVGTLGETCSMQIIRTGDSIGCGATLSQRSIPKV